MQELALRHEISSFKAPNGRANRASVVNLLFRESFDHPHLPTIQIQCTKSVPPDMIASAHRLFKLSPTYVVIHRAATNVWIPTTLMKKSHALLLQDDDGGRNML